LIPFLIWWYGKKKQQATAASKFLPQDPFTVSTAKNYFRHVPFILRLLAVSALIIAVARPQKRNDQRQTQGEGIDIILCMDVSGSMNSRDILPSRMEVAKEVAGGFCTQSDRLTGLALLFSPAKVFRRFHSPRIEIRWSYRYNPSKAGVI
jgi:Ca-activated chloride channel family protein